MEVEPERATSPLSLRLFLVEAETKIDECEISRRTFSTLGVPTPSVLRPPGEMYSARFFNFSFLCSPTFVRFSKAARFGFFAAAAALDGLETARFVLFLPFGSCDVI